MLPNLNQDIKDYLNMKEIAKIMLPPKDFGDLLNILIEEIKKTNTIDHHKLIDMINKHIDIVYENSGRSIL